jgi:hypothetical protein
MAAVGACAASRNNRDVFLNAVSPITHCVGPGPFYGRAMHTLHVKRCCEHLNTLNTVWTRHTLDTVRTDGASLSTGRARFGALALNDTFDEPLLCSRPAAAPCVDGGECSSEVWG